MIEQVDTDEQKAIVEFVRSGKGHLLIDALAGSGKTSTLFKALPFVPQKSVLMCAFNKPIADELQARMGQAPAGSVWKAATFHSCGLKIVHAHRPRLDIRKEASEDLVNEAALEWEADQAASDGSYGRVPRGGSRDMPVDRWYSGGGDRTTKKPALIKRVAFNVRRVAVDLLRKMKDTQTARELGMDVIRSLGETYDLFRKLDESEINIAIFVAARAYFNGQDLKSRRSIDFCDMTWLPVVLDLAPPSRFQVVFVDEAQDLSFPQLQLVKKLVAPNGRLVMVGDLFQAIYKWRGAVGTDVWKEMIDVFKAAQLSLTTTFRCSVAAVKAANRIVPQLKAMPTAPEGDEYKCNFQELPQLLRDAAGEGETFVLSRNNADLLHTTLYLWKADVGFQLRAGKEIVEPLYDIIDKLDKSSKQRFAASCSTWYQVETGKAEAINASAWADRIEQQYKSLQMMLSYAEPKEFKTILQDILQLSAMSPITLSTVHKVKGLEAERVFLLKHTFARYRYEREIEEATDPWVANRARDRLASIDQEELNLEYVAITRAKRDVIWVDMRGQDTTTLAKLYDVKVVKEPEPASDDLYDRSGEEIMRDAALEREDLEEPEEGDKSVGSELSRRFQNIDIPKSNKR